MLAMIILIIGRNFDFQGWIMGGQGLEGRIAAYFAVIGKNGALSIDPERSGARPPRQFQRERANFCCAVARFRPGSVLEDFGEFFLGRRVGVDNEDAFGFDGGFRYLPGISRIGGFC